MDSLPWHIQIIIFEYIDNKINACKSGIFMSDITNKYLIDLLEKTEIICEKCDDSISIYNDCICKMCYNNQFAETLYSTIILAGYIAIFAAYAYIILYVFVDIFEIIINFIIIIMPYFVIMFGIEKIWQICLLINIRL